MVLFRKGAHGFAFPDIGAQGEHLVQTALYVDDIAVLRKAVHGGHALDIAVKGQFIHTRRGCLGGRAVKAPTIGAGKQRRFRGIARQYGFALLVLGGYGVVAQPHGVHKRRGGGIFRGIHDRKRFAQGRDRHAVHGQGACFVRADHRGAAQSLHGRQAADDGVLRDHLLYADGQHNGHDGQQPFGNGGYGQADGRHKHLARVVAIGYACYKDQYAYPDAQQRQLFTKVGHAALKRRFHTFLTAQHARDGAQLRLHTRSDDDALAPPIGDKAAGISEVRPVAQGKVPVARQGFSVLFHRLAFAGEGAFIHAQPCRYRKAQIGRHIIARLQQHHVAGGQVRCGHGDDCASAAHLRVG